MLSFLKLGSLEEDVQFNYFIVSNLQTQSSVRYLCLQSLIVTCLQMPLLFYPLTLQYL